MSLENKIETKLSEALKNKDKNVFPTLRLVLSAIKDLKITKKMREDSLKDEEIINILKKMIKQRNESCEVYKKAGRSELFDNETREINVISTFLPKQLSEEETKRVCEEIIKSIGASSMKDMGKVMGELKSKYADTLDFSKVSGIIKGLLN